MKKLAIILTSLVLLVTAHVSYAKMDPCVGMTKGPGNVHIWYHDNNDDGKADYKATYVVVDNKLKLILKENLKPKEFKSPINPK